MEASGATEGSHDESGEVEDNGEDVDVLDVLQCNRDFMERSEELYDSLMASHWEPLDSITSPIPALS
ncbi:hypothetical protein CRUP_015520 [Coryphaenoides rupestris]|nr:hypothetical protein CRUP_015520 [Coryphaenoides rupestris]